MNDKLTQIANLIESINATFEDAGDWPDCENHIQSILEIARQIQTAIPAAIEDLEAITVDCDDIENNLEDEDQCNASFADLTAAFEQLLKDLPNENAA